MMHACDDSKYFVNSWQHRLHLQIEQMQLDLAAVLCIASYDSVSLTNKQLRRLHSMFARGAISFTGRKGSGAYAAFFTVANGGGSDESLIM